MFLFLLLLFPTFIALCKFVRVQRRTMLCQFHWIDERGSVINDYLWLFGTVRSNDATATRTSLKKSLYRLFLPTYFVNCRRTLLKLNFKGPNSSSEREIKFRRCLFTTSVKREMRHFHVVVVQKRKRNVQKSVMHVRSCCCAN